LTGPKPIAGAPVPLFDRLVDDEAQPRRILDAAGLRASVAAELERLLNTRAPIAADQLAERPRSTIDYGLPDLSYFLSGAGMSRGELARLIEETIEAFEPRLLAPRAAISEAPERREALIVEISGKLAIGTVMQPVAFVLPLQGLTAESEAPDE
jgi:type VI secretion system lysozyme-like protein